MSETAAGVESDWVKNHWIVPDWPAPAPVRACVTTRVGGISQAPYESCNLALHVGDVESRVIHNRRLLRERLRLRRVQWLTQVHGAAVVEVGGANRATGADGALTADGCTTRRGKLACAVMTADCLPVLICDRRGTQVAALHAGWRGLARGVLANGVGCFSAPARELLAYLGPAIGRIHFEVGAEVLEAFSTSARTPEHRRAVEAAFVANAQQPRQGPPRFHADLYALARAELKALGVAAIYGGGCCTFADGERFYSYRRQARTGRMASLIWLQPTRS